MILQKNGCGVAVKYSNELVVDEVFAKRFIILFFESTENGSEIKIVEGV